MKYSLLSLSPHKDFEITQNTISICYPEETVTIIKDNSLQNVSIIAVDVKGIEKDSVLPLDRFNVRFSIRDEDGKCLLFPQMDGMEILGSLTEPDVVKVVQANLQKYAAQITRVSELEQNERLVGSSKIEGNLPSDSNKGYALICQLYLLIYPDGLSAGQKKYLYSAYKTLNELAELADKTERLSRQLNEILRKSQELEKYVEDNSSDYTKELSSIIKRLMKNLKENKVIYLNYGMGASFDSAGQCLAWGHHEVMKISGELGSYSCTIYNAGIGSELTNKAQGLVAGAVQHELKCSTDDELKRFIRLVHERLLRGNHENSQTAESFKQINTMLKEYLGREIRKNQTQKQVRGNCTTMSNRLFLQEFLPNELYKQLYNFVSNTKRIYHATRDVGELIKQKDDNSPHLGKARILQAGIIQHNTDTLIHLVNEAGKEKSSTYLIKNYELGNKKKGTLLHYAIENASLALAQSCLKAGMTGLEEDAAGCPALHLAIRKGQMVIAEAIIANCPPEHLSYVGENGKTAIHLAIEHDHLAMVDQLMAKKVDLSPSANGNYVVFNAIVEKSQFGYNKEYYLALVETILDNPSQYNIDLTQKDGLGQNALEILLSKISLDDANKCIADEVTTRVVNKLCLAYMDIKPSYFLASHPAAVPKILPILESATFEELTKFFIRHYVDSHQPAIHYYWLIMPVLYANDSDKLKYLLSQRKAKLPIDIFIYMSLLLEKSTSTFSPVSDKNIKLILGNVYITEECKNNLSCILNRYFNNEQVNNILEFARVRQKNVNQALVAIKEQSTNNTIGFPPPEPDFQQKKDAYADEDKLYDKFNQTLKVGLDQRQNAYGLKYSFSYLGRWLQLKWQKVQNFAKEHSILTRVGKWLFLGLIAAIICYFTGGLAAIPFLAKAGALAILLAAPVMGALFAAAKHIGWDNAIRCYRYFSDNSESLLSTENLSPKHPISLPTDKTANNKVNSGFNTCYATLFPKDEKCNMPLASGLARESNTLDEQDEATRKVRHKL